MRLATQLKVKHKAMAVASMSQTASKPLPYVFYHRSNIIARCVTFAYGVHR